MSTKQEPRMDSVLHRIRLYFDTLQKTTENYLFVTDLQDGIVMLSDNFIESFDLSGTLLKDMDRQWLPLIHPDDRDTYQRSMAALADGSALDHDMEYRIRYRTGEYGWVSCHGMIGKDANGKPVIFAGVITKLDKRTMADNVTGLRNRYAFDKELRRCLSENPEIKGAVVIVGLDNFHIINETYGHHFGDAALRQIAKNVTNVLPPDIHLYKLDGDLFGMFWPDAMPEEIEIIFSSVQLAMREIRNAEDTIYCTASAGAAFYPADGEDAITLMKYAEAAMEMARRLGRDRICFFSKESYDRWRYDVSMQGLMQNSIARGCEDFFLYFQPQVDAKDGRLLGAEALLRWQDSDGSIVAPMQFIPLLEKTRMIIPVGHWIIEQAVKTCKKWQKYMPDFQMSINISLYQLEEHMLYPFVEDCLARYDIDPRTIVFELTESQSVSDWEYVNEAFKHFHDLGIQIAMDDFGTGYSSLGLLKNFDCNIIKIDRVFVEDILSSEFNRNLVKYTIKLCHSIGMVVCIEGVEEEEPYLFLRDECKADIIQGFYFGRPEPEDEFVKRLV